MRQVTIVTSEACHWCEEAKDTIERLSRSHPLQIRTVDALEPEGRQLLHAHAASMYPLVLVDGQYFSHGRLPRRRFEELLNHG